MEVPAPKPTLVAVEFEIYGHVTGTFFTKYCRDMATQLSIRGWARNTKKSTVVGQIQGEKDKVEEMAMWLRLQGSPGSKIEKADFRNWAIIESYDYRNFRVMF